MTRFTRSQWGAAPASPGRGDLLPNRVVGIALHWPAMPKPLRDVDAVKAALRGWQDYHQHTHGWSDIAYQEAIDQQGNTYVLRGLRAQSAANGSTFVNQRYGALLLVVAEGEHPSDALIAATARRVDRHRELFPRSRKIVGHQDVRPEPTSCPGPAIEQLLRAGAFGRSR